MRKLKIALTEFKPVYGSRTVVKSIGGEAEDGKNHFYNSDLWSEWGEKISDAIPDGWIVFAEIVGFTSDGQAIQKGYTYNQQPGTSELYIYRVATVNPQGRMVDLNWDAVKEFAITSGLKHVPELWRGKHEEFNADDWVDKVFYRNIPSDAMKDVPIALSDPKTVDEGVVVRYDVSYVPYLLKAKSPIFLGWETAELDKGIIDIESEES